MKYVRKFYPIKKSHRTELISKFGVRVLAKIGGRVLANERLI